MSRSRGVEVKLGREGYEAGEESGTEDVGEAVEVLVAGGGVE